MSVSAILLATTLGGSWAAPPDTLARVAHLPHPRSTAVAVTILVPQGSGADPEGKSGSGWLLAHALSEEANRRMASLSARVTPQVGRGETAFNLLAVPGSWEEAALRLQDVLFRGPPDSVSLEAVRSRLLEQLRFEDDAPVRRFQQEVDNLLYGSAHAWSRPIRGNPVSVEAVTAADLETLQRRGYRPKEAVAVLVGPGGRADSVLSSLPGPEGDSVASNPGEEVATGSGTAWTRGDRIEVSRPVTSSWVAVAYPLPPGLPRSEAEFLSHVLQEELVPTPSDPWLFGAQVRIEEGEEGSILLVSAALMPEMAARWEERVVESVSSLGATPVDEAFFRLQRRRFRSAALLGQAAPEARSWAGARDLLRKGTLRDLPGEIERLQAETLRNAALRLGPPRILILGPDLSQEDSG